MKKHKQRKFQFSELLYDSISIQIDKSISDSLKIRINHMFDIGMANNIYYEVKIQLRNHLREQTYEET